ncbi:hypothetical protein ACRAWD_17915 [Caulobacter segnis]
MALVAVYCGFNLLRLLPFPVPEQLDLKRLLRPGPRAPEVYAPMRRLAAAYHDRQAAEAAAAWPTPRGPPGEDGRPTAGRGADHPLRRGDGSLSRRRRAGAGSVRPDRQGRDDRRPGPGPAGAGRRASC